ncbi:hypothetical protein F2Q69_00058710 [Brassica cretica]|uniref:Uncharacterized protein n=1 Tax=Brassica cretica TaxID=69181 RepID=A0A8S9RBT4_BRACR|nr:hypothetical protein F2Q69_00058710 [Brassica cretica]
MATHNMHTEEYDEDYEEERAIEQRANLDEEDRLLHHSSWKKKSPSIDRYGSTSIDTQPHQPNHLRASTEIAYFPSINTNVDATRDRDYSIGSLANDRYNESYTVETTYRDQGADELHEGFTYEELLNMQRRDETDQNRAEAAWGRTRFSHPIDRAIRPSIDINPSTSIDVDHTTSIDIRSKPKTNGPRWLRKRNRRTHTARISRRYRRHPSYSQWSRQSFRQRMEFTKEFYDTAGGIDKSFKQRSRHPTQQLVDIDVPASVNGRPKFGRRAFHLFGARRFYWEEKDEYGIYRDYQGYARDLDGHAIRVHSKDIRRLLERGSRDEPNYICLPENASSFTQTKLVPEIHTRDEINEMFYGVCREQEKNKEAFQMKLDGDYYPLNDSISWLTTCMEEMKQDISRIQHATDVTRPTSIDRHQRASIDIDSLLPASIDNCKPESVDDNLPHPHSMKSQPDLHTREEIDQLVEGIYRALETTEERLDGRCDDIYFPMDLRISALTSKIEAIQGELVEIQSYIARRPEASASIDRRNNKSTDIHHRTSVDEASNRERLVQKVTSDMPDTHNHGEEISAGTYARLMRHKFILESLGDRFQKIEDATTIMKDKWRRGYEAMRDFTADLKLKSSPIYKITPDEFYPNYISFATMLEAKYGSKSIDTQPHQPNHLRASTDIAYFPSINTNVDATRDGDYSIGSLADDRYHESYAVETAYRDQGADELHEGFTYEELLNMQRRDETDQNRAEAAWGRTRFSHPIDRAIRPSIDRAIRPSIDRAIRPSIDINPSTSIDVDHTTSIDIRPKPKTTRPR